MTEVTELVAVLLLARLVVGNIAEVNFNVKTIDTNEKKIFSIGSLFLILSLRN